MRREDAILNGDCFSRVFVDLRRLGQTTQVKPATADEVRAHIQDLLEQFNANKTAQQQEYDFEARVAAIAKQEADRRREEKERKAEKKRKERERANGAGAGGGGGDAEMMAMMGFGGFGSSKK